jgi:hypothetical protein
MNVMKNRFHLILIAVVILAGWTACDKIDEPLKIVSVQNIPENINDTLFYMDSVSVTQKQVLLEDFTGHKCVNCPTAGNAAHQWAEDFNHRLIIYGIHAGYQAEPDETGLYTTDFRCPTGDELFNYFDHPFNPSATVNRVKYNGNIILYYITGDWEAAVNLEMAKDNVINMKVKNTYFPNKKAVLINISSSILQPLEGKYKIVVYLVEDHIIAAQKNNDSDLGPEPDWEDYDHRNVLRDAVNGTFGTYVSDDGTVAAGGTYSNVFYYTINDEWLTGTTDLNIIAYIYNEESGEVLQVAELEIKREE